MDFEYKIEDDSVMIFEYKNRSSKTVVIPKTIEGYPVTRISNWVFFNCKSLKYINGVELKHGINNINDKFIYHGGFFKTIKYIIGSDYTTINNLGYEYFIGNKSYTPLFY